MQFFNLAIAVAAALVAAEEAIAPQGGQPKVITKFVHSKPVKKHRPCPPVHCDVCPYQRGDFFVLKDKVPFFKAECACREKGGVLAELNSYNFHNATDVNFNCIGPNNYAWVKSWNTDDYHHSCLALYTGSTPGGGAVAVPISCQSHASVLCQRVHKHCEKPDNCFEFVWEWTEVEDWVIPCHQRDHECHRWWDSCDHCKPHNRPPHHGQSNRPQMKIIN